MLNESFIVYFQRKTASQRQADWKLRNLDQAKARDILKSKHYREKLKNTLTEEEKVIKRQKETERKKKLRMKNKALNQVPAPSKFPFATPQVQGKMIKKTRETLKGTAKQNISVLKSLLCELSYEEPVERYRFLPDSTVKMVTDFYNNEEISRASPNSSDHVTVMENNQRKKISVKHLMFPIKEIYGMFCEENPTLKISIAKFFKLRPANILSFTKIAHNVCCCQIHENVRCALKALQKLHPDLNFNVDYNMHRNFICDGQMTECFHNTCEDCKNAALFKTKTDVIQNLSETISWLKWVKMDKTPEKDQENDQKLYCNIEKVKKTGTVKELLDEIFDKIPEFLQHEYIKKNQAMTSAKQMQKSLEADAKCAVIVCDFAEKFKCCQQNATQSAHYGQTPVSLFTCAIYHRDLMPVTIASDCDKHTKESVLAYMDAIFDLLPVTVEEVEIWSDNATSQFKNQFIMEGLKSFESRYKKKVKWNFFAPMHGKSVVDGIGGSVKRYVKRRILSQNLLVKSAEDFVQIASQSDVNVILLKTSEINRRNLLIGLARIIKESKKIPDIKKKHCFEIQNVKLGKKFVNKIIASEISQSD